MSATEWVKAAFDQHLSASAAASVLVVMVLIIQWLLRKRLSAAYRYGLWLPVLVRLLLPVVPESPFSLFNVPRWFEGKHNEVAAVVPRTVVPRPAGQVLEKVIDFPQPHLVSPVPQTKGWSRADFWNGVVWVWCGGVLVLLGRLAVGSLWLRFRLKGGAHAATAELRQIMAQAGKDTGVRAPRILMTGMVESPALFGVFRPKLLLPAGFEGKLDARGVRHVFLHEMAHIKRGDLPVNFFMTVAQAVHWMNPLVWLACRRMRLERELACDEMALSFSHGAEAREYGATILRLLTGLEQRRRFPALVGIAEEKYAAKRRIEGIAAFQPRKQAGWVVALVLAMLALVGLTKAQTTGTAQVLTDAEWEHKFQTATVEGFELGKQTLPEALEGLRKKLPRELQDAVFCSEELHVVMEGQPPSPSSSAYIASPVTNTDSSAFSLKIGPLKVGDGTAFEVVKQMSKRAEGIHSVRMEGRKVIVMQGTHALQEWWTKTNSLSKSPPSLLKGRQLIAYRLNSIIIPEFQVEPETRLDETIKRMSKIARANDPLKLGVNIIISSNFEKDANGAFVGVPVEEYTVSVAAKNMKFGDLLDMIVETAVPPAGSGSTNRLKYLAEDYAVVISKSIKEEEALFPRTFKVDPRAFVQGVEVLMHNEGMVFRPGEGTNAFCAENLMNLFMAAGADFSMSPRSALNGGSAQQKACFYNDRMGILFVRATLKDLYVVEGILLRLNIVRSQISLEVMEVRFESAEQADKVRQKIAAVAGNLRSVLTDAEFRKIQRDIAAMSSAPKIDSQRLSTLSGRVARLNVEGSRVEIMADADSDFLINLKTSTWMNGREDTRHRIEGNLYNGQTVLALPHRDAEGEFRGAMGLLFITAVLLDSAGNPIQPTGNPPYDTGKIPPQPGE